MASFAKCQEKMEAEGLPPAAVKAFENAWNLLASGSSGMIPETDISPAEGVPSMEELSGKVTPNPALLGEAVMLKLNGGLGTSMGLDKVSAGRQGYNQSTA